MGRSPLFFLMVGFSYEQTANTIVSLIQKLSLSEENMKWSLIDFYWNLKRHF